MEANNFISKLKACGAKSDICELKEALQTFKVILVKLPEKDKSSFSLNVLCSLCRNLEKVPTWRASINNTDLITFSIECVRHTQNMQISDQVRTLACIFHTHRHVIKQSSNIPPELILKLSFLPFECDEDSLLSDYHKTYWSILADRLTYMEKLKSLKLPIIKLLPKFTDDVIKVIKIYDTVQFCANLLTFLVKKLHCVYNDVGINGSFEKIFECIAKKDLKQFKLLQDKDIIDIYVKFNDCLYVIAESGLRCNDSVFENVSRIIITILGHRPDMFHCMQMLYPNAFCCIFRDKTNVNLIDNILNCLLTSCQITEKLGYKQTVNASYPYLSQLLRLYVENILSNKELSKSFNEAIQEKCLKLILFLLTKLRNTNQMLRCENCPVRSGLHDALRLTFHIKNFVTASTNNETDIKNILPLYIDVIKQQYIILEELNCLGCGNYTKCLNKLQTDTHNTAIVFNKSKYYEESIELFDIYLKNEFRGISSDVQMKNMSRALYNKSICQLDFTLYEDSLKNAYLSLIFSLPHSVGNEKYMSLVMDIKAKASKQETDVQTWSVLDVCKHVVNENPYGDLGSLVKNLEFSDLLKLEFSMYVKLWPSIPPIAGVWNSLYDMTKGDEDCIMKENPDKILWTLYEIVMATSAAVRTIHNETYKHIVYRLIEGLQGKPEKSPKEKLVYAALLSLKSEYEMTEAGLKYGWKGREMDADAPSTRCILHEREVLHSARMAVREMADVTGDSFGDMLGPCLRVISLLVPEMFHLSDDVHALQLAALCCDLALKINEREIFIRNAGYLVHKSDGQTDLQNLIEKAAEYCKEMVDDPQNMDIALNFMCEVAIYHIKLGNLSISGKLVQAVQVKMLMAYEINKEIDLDLSLGRLMEAQAQLCSVLSTDCPSVLSELNSVHRHYLSMASSDNRWCFRRNTSLVIKLRVSTSGARCVSLARALRAVRRARAAAAVASRTGAARAARILAQVMTGGEGLQVKIDNTLKFILGIQSDATEPNHAMMTKQHHFTPKTTNLEAMRDCMLKKIQASPTLPCTTIPVFQIPEFLNHACTCSCHACELPACIIIACQICFLEASAYFRAKENEIARNYFNGALNAFEIAEVKLKKAFEVYKRDLRAAIVDTERRDVERDFKQVQIEFYVELSYFELSQGDFETSDEYVLKIHEIMSDMRDLDPYLRNEVYNLMIASAQIRKNLRKPKEIGLEAELENLKLSPDKDVELQKTPEAKATVPKIGTVRVVKDEEIPKRRKVIKLNLDEASEESNEERTTRSKTIKPQFKIPVPVTARPVLETITPRATRSRPEIIIQQPSLDHTDIKIFTPKTSNTNEFFTPRESTPAEQFFTPQTSIKTYSRRIIKNLDKEFSTPKGKENSQDNVGKKVDTGSVKVLRDKRVLRRATSPGKLVQKTESRPRRIRQPVID
ncbi:uncharacterized protein LOC116776992 [Danaus plexippus]|uniref:uncharacterized protein LOC116776992 n=1 Tax=Danaus plexippus TaxID=13037 RepID=UPI002AB05220|nr:uncharacterized protein LOC116776992 [Danaus plexippus]